MIRPENFPHYGPAFEAWRNRDPNRFVAQCMMLLDIPFNVRGEGTIWRWSYINTSAVVYITFDKTADEFAIEAPLITVPATDRVGLYRQLLEMNDSLVGDARFCLRGDIVVLLMTDHFDNFSPPVFIGAIRDMDHLSQLDTSLSMGFEAPIIGPEAQVAGEDWKFLGEPVKLDIPKAARRPSAEPPSQLSNIRDPGADLDAFFHEAQTQLRAAEFLIDNPLVAYLLHRAIVYRAYVHFVDTFPDAVRLLVRSAVPFIDAPLRKGDPGLPNAYSLANEYAKIMKFQGQVGPERAPKITVAKRVKQLVGTLVHQAGKSKLSAPMLHFVLLGIVSEVFVRAPLSEEAMTQLRAVIARSEKDGARPETNQYMLDYLRRLT